VTPRGDLAKDIEDSEQQNNAHTEPEDVKNTKLACKKLTLHYYLLNYNVRSFTNTTQDATLPAAS